MICCNACSLPFNLSFILHPRCFFFLSPFFSYPRLRTLPRVFLRSFVFEGSAENSIVVRSPLPPRSLSNGLYRINENFLASTDLHATKNFSEWFVSHSDVPSLPTPFHFLSHRKIGFSWSRRRPLRRYDRAIRFNPNVCHQGSEVKLADNAYN